MAEFMVNPWGFVLALDHSETQEALTVVDTLKERIPQAIEKAIALGIISAAVFNPVTVGVVVTAIVSYFTVQKELIRASDKGYGVYLTLPHAAIFIAIQGGVIALALIIPGTRPAPQPQPTPQPQPVNPTRGIGDHFYTTSAQERDAALTTLGYVLQGIACYVFEVPVTGTTPFYRLLNHQNGDHFYTTKPPERDTAITTYGYVTEGIACYVFDSQVAGTTPFYRLLNRQNGDHFYTTKPPERDTAITTYGYVLQGIACYVFDAPLMGLTALHRLLKRS